MNIRRVLFCLSANPCAQSPCSAHQRCVVNSQRMASCVCSTPYCQRRKRANLCIEIVFVTPPPPPTRFPSSVACTFTFFFCLLVQETSAFQTLAWMVASVNRKACSVSPANVVPDFKDWPVRFVSFVSMHRRHAAFVVRLSRCLFRFIRWCLLAEPVSKWWIMCFRRTNRIISMLLSSGIHGPHLRYG